jgi:hypothetical protein
VTAGLVHVPGDAAHRDRRGDDHIGELVKQVITSTVNPLPAVPSMHADERIGHLADLLGQLQQPHLGRDIPVMGIQLANLIPHGLPPVLDADPADSPPLGDAEAAWPRHTPARTAVPASVLSRLAAHQPCPARRLDLLARR